MRTFFLIFLVFTFSKVFSQFSGEQIITTCESCFPNSISNIDLDKDGDMDILSTFRNKVTLNINDGDGVFSSKDIITDLIYGYGANFVDLDGDNDLDVLMRVGTKINNIIFVNKIVWYENIGDNDFSEQKLIATLGDRINKLFSVDLDGDNDLDLIAASVIESNITATTVWYENNGQGIFSEKKEISLLSVGDSFGGVSYPADLDGDGDLDLINTAAELNKSIIWYENNGLGDFVIQDAIETRAIRARDIRVVDIDEDGNLDVVAVFIKPKLRIRWYKNDGIGNFSEQKVIPTREPAGIQDIQLHSADLDCDGDIDILTGSTLFDIKITWNENDGIGDFSDEKIIDIPTTRPSSINLADLDGDNDIDVLAAFDIDNKVVWYENLVKKTTSTLNTPTEKTIIITPNPFNEFITIKQVDFSPNLNRVQIFDVSGRQVNSLFLKDPTQQISTTSLANGLYIYHITNADGQVIANGKVVKH